MSPAVDGTSRFCTEQITPPIPHVLYTVVAVVVAFTCSRHWQAAPTQPPHPHPMAPYLDTTVLRSSMTRTLRS